MFRSRWLLLVLVLAAGAVGWVASRALRVGDRDSLQDLVALRQAERPVDARLTGGFAYGQLLFV